MNLLKCCLIISYFDVSILLRNASLMRMHAQANLGTDLCGLESFWTPFHLYGLCCIIVMLKVECGLKEREREMWVFSLQTYSYHIKIFKQCQNSLLIFNLSNLVLYALAPAKPPPFWPWPCYNLSTISLFKFSTFFFVHSHFEKRETLSSYKNFEVSQFKNVDSCWSCFGKLWYKEKNKETEAPY